MNANELADNLLKNGGNCSWFKEIATMLRQQQAEIEFLKKEILEKHEDWKHEGQQAANARAEIEALKDMLEEEGIGVSQKYLDERIAELRKAQE